MSTDRSTESDQHGYILVGVDGSPADEGALRYAVNVSRRINTDIVVAHVATGYSAILPVDDIDLEGAAQGVLDTAVNRACELGPAAGVRGVMLHGQRPAAMLQTSQEARLVVLGEQHRNRLERFVTGSTVATLSSGAPCNVVVVPDTWQGDDHGAVGVGVKTLEGASIMVDAAARIASGRGARLEVVHAWHLPVAAYDALTLPGVVDTQGWTADMTEALTKELEPTVAAYPDVEIRLTVVEGHPASMMADLGARVDLLVLARRTKAFPRGHLGGTARALLRETPCPVLVLPHRDALDDYETFV